MFGHRIVTCLVLVDTTPNFSKAVVQITISTVNEYESACLLSPLKEYVVIRHNAPEWQM